jgi:hypothetical protein
MSKRVWKVAGIVLLSLFAIAGVSGYLYYRSFKNTPQYSLALLVDAAKRDDKDEIAKLVDTDAVVDDFVAQIVDHAVELYGRGLPQAVIDKIAVIAEPIMPAIKDRARAQLPGAIRVRSQRLANIPFFAMVLAADKYLDIKVNGDIATLKSKDPNRPLEMRMRRNGDRWQVVGVKDDQLATDIARSIGQQIISLASAKLTEAAADRLGVGNLFNLLKQAEELVGQ